MQLGGIALGPADSHGLAGLADHQRLSTSHGFFLKLGQLLRLSVGPRDNILMPGQSGVKLLAGVPVVGNAGENIGQIDQDAVPVHPAGTVQAAAGPRHSRL